MDPLRSNRILSEWASVANAARRPSEPPYPVAVRSGLPTATLAGAALLIVAIVGAGMWLGRQGPSGVVGGPSIPPSPTATPVATPSASPSATATPTPTASPTPTPTPTPRPTIGPCDPAKLPTRITLWEGAAGHRIAHMELTNAGTASCTITSMARPQLVDGRGSVLIDGASPPASGRLTVAPGAILKTLVQDGNYCGPAPVAPVSVAFVLSNGGRIVATPFSPTDVTLPPCNGGPGSAGTIEMQPWAP